MRTRVRVNLAGQKFGRLTAIEPNYIGGRSAWLVRCDCGTEKSVNVQSLRGGRVRSCGCLKKRVEPIPANAMEECLRLISIGALQIDDNGHVWKKKRLVSGGVWRDITPRRIESSGRRGYLYVVFGVGTGKTMQVLAHRLVWTFLHGPIPEGLQINHKDMCTSNNHPDNLEVVTNLENFRHAQKHRALGRRNKTWCGKPVLSDEQIIDMRAKREAGATLEELSKEFNKNHDYVRDLCVGNSRSPKKFRK